MHESHVCARRPTRRGITRVTPVIQARDRVVARWNELGALHHGRHERDASATCEDAGQKVPDSGVVRAVRYKRRAPTRSGWC